MKQNFYAVQPLRNTEIEKISSSLRDVFDLGERNVHMINMIEKVPPEVLPDYNFFVLPDEEMPGLDGITGVAGQKTIMLSNSTYESLFAEDPEARYIAAHELGHFILHSQQTPMLAKRNRNVCTVDPEWQADRFADYWLVPTEGVRKCRSPNHVAAKYNVSDELAQRRWLEVKIEGIQGELF